MVKTLTSAGVKENVNLFDYETVDKKLSEFYMQQTIDKLDNLKLHDDSKLKLYSSIFSLDSNIPNYLKVNLKQLILKEAGMPDQSFHGIKGHANFAMK